MVCPSSTCKIVKVIIIIYCYNYFYCYYFLVPLQTAPEALEGGAEGGNKATQDFKVQIFRYIVGFKGAALKDH